MHIDLSEQQAKDLVDSCDINGDGHVSFIDFIQMFNDENEVYFPD